MWEEPARFYHPHFIRSHRHLQSDACFRRSSSSVAAASGQWQSCHRRILTQRKSQEHEDITAFAANGLGVMSPLSFSRGMGPLTGPVMSSLIHSRQVEALGDLGLELFDIDAVEP